ncbi:CHAT domain-containing protein [Coleofasciculus sp. FACHB-T130]|uniref:CHAT domain-containing tetratricopeptide repeat protein n=1 Tax=Cyanophyceae TaxID=3028117 RepID=UPI001685A9CC|nr:CHAT domain-containing protein [Coleofasciculus sp. FACHB-T130]MBD1881997.1 CHAT domain-containing protein [Coleofasciculus sp. FACHB-T130]
MYPRLKSGRDAISLVSTIAATLLICLNSSIDGRSSHPYAPLPASAQVQTTQERKAEALRLNQVGVQQLNTSKFRVQRALQTLGVRQLNTRKFRVQQALQTFEQALVIVRAIGDRQGEVVTLNNIGEAYLQLEQDSKALKSLQQALATFEQALVIVRAIGDRQGEAVTLNNIGEAYLQLEQDSKALKSLQQALAIAIGDRQGKAVTLNNIGEAYLQLRQYSKALESLQQALAINREVNNKTGEVETFGIIARIYSLQGQKPKALEIHQQALAIFRELGNRVNEYHTLLDIGEIYSDIGQYAKALESLQQALAINREVGNKFLESAILSRIAWVYQTLGRDSKAQEFEQQAAKISSPFPIGEINIPPRLDAKTLELAEQALAISRKVGDTSAQIEALKIIAAIYVTSRQNSKALESSQQVLAIARKVGDTSAQIEALKGIEFIYLALGQHSKALESIQQALAISREVGDRLEEATILREISDIYLISRQNSKTLEPLQQALAIARKVGDKTREFSTLTQIADIYHYTLSQYPLALEFYQQALAIAREVGNKPNEAETLRAISFVHLLTGNFAEATETLLTTVKVMESVRSQLSDADKVAIFEKQVNNYMALQKALIAQNKTEAAIEIAERGRARAFVELLANRLASNPTAQVTIKPPSIKEIQQIAKEQNATIVEYSIVDLEDRQKVLELALYIWVIKPTGEVAFKKVDLKSLKSSLEDLVTNSRNSIGVRGRNIFDVDVVAKPESDQTQRLQQLHKLLIEPIAQFLPTNPSDRVIFIPQESLFLVPFAALQDANGKYLIEKHTIVTAPAIQVLQLTQQQRREVSGTQVLVVGNPTMPKISPKVGEPPQQLSQLPGAEKEAQAIAQLLNTKPIIGNAATKAAILPQMSKAKIIHLATHGLLDDFKGLGVPGAIALAPAGTDDGLLTSAEIFDLKLNAELAVLSACDTGRGKITGDGVIGLSRSLISAGVPSVIVSLWSVPDSPTASLMTEFYRQMQQNSDKATALRQAMLTTMKQHPDPKNWAAFTLIGEAQ